MPFKGDACEKDDESPYRGPTETGFGRHWWQASEFYSSIAPGASGGEWRPMHLPSRAAHAMNPTKLLGGGDASFTGLRAPDPARSLVSDRGSDKEGTLKSDGGHDQEAGGLLATAFVAHLSPDGRANPREAQEPRDPEEEIVRPRRASCTDYR